MTVKELIQELLQHDPNAEVIISEYSRDGRIFMSVSEVEKGHFSEKKRQFMVHCDDSTRTPNSVLIDWM